MQNLSKLHGVLRIEHQTPISVIKQKKWMQYQNIMILKKIIAYLNYFYINIIYIF